MHLIVSALTETMRSARPVSRLALQAVSAIRYARSMKLYSPAFLPADRAASEAPLPSGF